MAKKSSVGRAASQVTRQELATQLAAATRLSVADIEDLFPRQADQAALLELVNVVKSAASENAAKAAITSRIDDFARVLVKIVKHVVV